MFYFSILLIFRLVTTSSKCLLRLYSHSTFKRDLVLGEGRIDINKQLVREQGKFDKTNLVLDIKVRILGENVLVRSIANSHCIWKQGELKTNSNVVPPATTANGRSARVKIGEVFIVLDGMRVDPKLLLTNSNRSSTR